MTDYFHLHMPEDQLQGISSLGLAIWGRGVRGDGALLAVPSRKATAKGLHRAAVAYVSAPAQAAMVEKIRPLLTQEETAVFRRGHNTKPHTFPAAATRRSISPPPDWRRCSAGCTPGGDGAPEPAVFRDDGGMKPCLWTPCA